MKNLKVYLQYPWKVSDSQYYKNILSNPPKGVSFLSNISNFGMITSKNKFLLTLIKNNLINLTVYYYPIFEFKGKKIDWFN